MNTHPFGECAVIGCSEPTATCTTHAAPVTQAATASQDMTMGEAFKAVGGWMNGGEQGYPSFGSMNALWAYTVKMVRSYAANSTASAQAAIFPERDLTRSAEQQGLYRKFNVSRVDGSDVYGGKHFGCRYFVLDLTHDQHAPAAMRAYAASCASTHPQLAADIVADLRAALAQQSAAPGGRAIDFDKLPVLMTHYLAGNVPDNLCWYVDVTAEVLRRAVAVVRDATQPAKFAIGDNVRKTKGSQWRGLVVGTYSTSLTPEGYAVESSTERGSVQIYPAAALELNI